MISPEKMPQKIIYGEQTIDYQIHFVAVRQKKIAIHIHPNGSVQVEAPTNTHLSEINNAVQKRARWVLKHLNQIEIQSSYILPREYISGETHFYLGRRYLLKIHIEKSQNSLSKNGGVKLIQGKFQIHTMDQSPHYIKMLLWDWYKTQSRIVFHRHLQNIRTNISWMHDELPQWKLLTMKKRWGSCSPKGIITLNPHLVKASNDCIDYVILHEICHLKEHNHSQRFYKLLDQNMPDWKVRKVKLDEMANLFLNE